MQPGWGTPRPAAGARSPKQLLLSLPDEDPILRQVQDRLKAGSKVVLAGLVPAAKAFYLRQLHERIGGHLILVTADEERAADLLRHLRALAALDRPDETAHIFSFPALGADPYQGVAPHFRAMADRVASLVALRRPEPALLVATAALMLTMDEAKAIIGYNPETKELKSGQVPLPKGFQYYLLKFDGVSDDQLSSPQGYGRLELAYHHMALDCGIHMQPCSLLEENGRAHFLTLRFDRTAEGEKLHMQTLCAMSHFDFNLAGGYSYEDAFEEMRALSLPYPDLDQLYKRMVFNVVARNQDDHTKNISFLMDKTGEWRLSPAYDLTWNYNPRGEWTNVHQMSINQKRDNFTIHDLVEVALRQGIKNPRETIERTVETVSRWNHFARETGVRKNMTEAAQRSHRLKF